MGSFHLTKMSLKNLLKKPATKMYPVVAPSYTSMSKGHVECEIKACTLCGLCERRCPTFAIAVSKADERWSINHFACIQCYNCVRACPAKCLTMRPEYTKPGLEMASESVTKPPLSPEEQAEKAAKEKERAERVAKALAAKDAKDAKAVKDV